MLGKFLLIDHYLNETRVAIVKDSILEDFDDELPTSKLKKGNIYIGRIMRIEPSLQAAFVDFGFEKHGFLAFSEIRPPEPVVARSPTPKPVAPDDLALENIAVLPEAPLEMHEGDDEERPKRPQSSPCKIHDLIKRQQLIMVQVIKDERGSKGAALTTYISLPGRYGFLLPNTLKASGISKKITDSLEREALKTILTSLEIPETMSFILRSASMGRKKSEIKRDYDFLMKTWEKIKAHPAQSIGLIYAEQDLLIRSLRDLYASDIQEVIIQGEEAFKRARSYIRAVFPSHSKKISLHTDTMGLFQKFQIESQIEAIYDHTVILPSGGSIVINPTEALVSIDVNSSKSTQERNIEDTALKTNLEATIAIARNLKLRDLAGLIVIDFIDLHPNKRPLVEKALKDALSMDRARLKIGKISEFGLLEMSRQRLRQSLMESNTHLCTICHGSGRLLSLPMQSMRALRAIERVASLAKQEPIIHAKGSANIILSLLNNHRQFLCDIEKKYAKTLRIEMDTSCSAGSFDITSPLISPDVMVKETSLVSKKRRRNNRGKPALTDSSSAANIQSTSGDSLSVVGPLMQVKLALGQSSQDVDSADATLPASSFAPLSEHHSTTDLESFLVVPTTFTGSTILLPHGSKTGPSKKQKKNHSFSQNRQNHPNRNTPHAKTSTPPCHTGNTQDPEDFENSCESNGSGTIPNNAIKNSKKKISDKNISDSSINFSHNNRGISLLPLPHSPFQSKKTSSTKSSPNVQSHSKSKKSKKLFEIFLQQKISGIAVTSKSLVETTPSPLLNIDPIFASDVPMDFAQKYCAVSEKNSEHTGQKLDVDTITSSLIIQSSSIKKEKFSVGKETGSVEKDGNLIRKNKNKNKTISSGTSRKKDTIAPQYSHHENSTAKENARTEMHATQDTASLDLAGASILKESVKRSSIVSPLQSSPKAISRTVSHHETTESYATVSKTVHAQEKDLKGEAIISKDSSVDNSPALPVANTEVCHTAHAIQGLETTDSSQDLVLSESRRSRLRKRRNAKNQSSPQALPQSSDSNNALGIEHSNVQKIDMKKTAVKNKIVSGAEKLNVSCRVRTKNSKAHNFSKTVSDAIILNGLDNTISNKECIISGSKKCKSKKSSNPVGENSLCNVSLEPQSSRKHRNKKSDEKPLSEKPLKSSRNSKNQNIKNLLEKSTVETGKNIVLLPSRTYTE